MPDHSREGRPGRRKGCRLQPSSHDHGLEPRLLLSIGLARPDIHSAAQVASIPRMLFTGPSGIHRRPATSPTDHADCRNQCSVRGISRGFALVETAYVESIVNGQTSTNRQRNRHDPIPFPARIQVDNAVVFGANGVFTTPLNATASLGGIPLGTTYCSRVAAARP